MMKKSLFLVLFLLLSFVGIPLSEELLEVRLGEITFRIREFDSIPSLRILECEVEVFNRSKKSIIPANSIKVVVTPGEPLRTPGEVTLEMPLLPGTGRILAFGFLHPGGDQPINFEVQINPPQGEKKTAAWKPRENLFNFQ